MPRGRVDQKCLHRASHVVGRQPEGKAAVPIGPLGEVRDAQREHLDPAPIGVEAAESLHRNLSDAVIAVGPRGGNRIIRDVGDRVVANGVDGAGQQHTRNIRAAGGLEDVACAVDIGGQDVGPGLLTRESTQVDHGVSSGERISQCIEIADTDDAGRLTGRPIRRLFWLANIEEQERTPLPREPGAKSCRDLTGPSCENDSLHNASTSVCVMIRTSVCAGPWDILGDPGAAERFAKFGADSVTLAAAYHAVRAATPQHSARRFVEATHSALYLPVRDQAWRGQRLRPASSASWTGDENAFGTARDALSSAGVRTAGWVVLTHNDPAAIDLGTAGLRVHNAFGDRLSHALCPSSDEVVEYCATLASEVAATGVDEIMLESIGQLGFEHVGTHDKTTGADWTAVDVALLSICCCAACVRLLNDTGIDTDAMASVIRSTVGSGVASVQDALGELAPALLALRQSRTRTLLSTVADAARSAGAKRVTAHAGLNPWATSSFSPVGPGPLPLDALVLSDSTVNDLSSTEISTIAAESGASVAGYVSALPPLEPDGLTDRWGTLADRGVRELVVYHGGLISAARASAVTDAIAAVTAITVPTAG